MLHDALQCSTYTHAELREHTSSGDIWLAINDRVYDVSHWARSHPGGELVLVHAAGKDATNAFESYHPSGAHRLLGRYCIGQLQRESASDPEKEAREVFEELKADVEDSGLMRSALLPYFILAGLLAVLFFTAFWSASEGWLVTSALATALFWQQSAFIGHDIGHSAVTHCRATDCKIGLFVNAAVGIGLSWWKSTHNVHHIVVNTVEDDPDIQFMPLLAVSDLFFQPLWSTYHQDRLLFDSTARGLISWQHVTFLPLLAVAKFGLYLQTVKQLCFGKAYISRVPESIAQAIFFLWYGWLVSLFPGAGRKVAFIFLSHAAFLVLHLQVLFLSASHKAGKHCGAADLPEPLLVPHNIVIRSKFSVLDDATGHSAAASAVRTALGEDFLVRGRQAVQVRGTMNWRCPWWLDWFHGGLQFQIEHHLFPRMPRHNLRAASRLVRPACLRLGLPYHSPSFLQAIAETLAALRDKAIRARSQSLAASQQLPAGCHPPLLPRLFI